MCDLLSEVLVICRVCAKVFDSDQAWLFKTITLAPAVLAHRLQRLSRFVVKHHQIDLTRVAARDDVALGLQIAMPRLSNKA